MATTVDKLIVEIKAETKGLRKGLDSVNKKLKTTNATAKASVLTFANLGKMFAIIGIARIGSEVVKTARQFEDLNATLRAVTGSARGAAVSMAAIEKFTIGTTFQLQNVTTAFITLMNAGITPTSGVLNDFGNLAAAFGKDITQIAQAVFNATTGETEMLKQFGIKAKLEGDKITLIFREVPITIDRSATSIVSALRKISQENYGTALEERLNTVSGAFANLKDMVGLVFRAMGEAGLNKALKETTQGLTEVIKRGIEPSAKAGVILHVVLKALGVVFQGIGVVVSILITNLELLLAALVGLAASALAPALVAIAGGFAKITRAIKAGTLAAMIFQSVTLGPLGMTKIAAGIAGATAAYVLLESQVSKLTDEMKEQGVVIDFNSMSIAQQDEELLKIAESLKKTMTPAVSGTKIAMGEMKEAVISSSNAFTTDFVDSLLEGESALESFKNFSKSIVSQIIAIFIQMAIVNKILNSVFSLTGTDKLPEIDIFKSKTDDSAGGGTVQGNRPVLVGERGAEIFVPNTGGTVMNAMNSKNAMGGGGTTIINQSINFATGIVPTVRAEVMKMMPQIADVTKGAVAEAAMRGGNYRRALQGG